MGHDTRFEKITDLFLKKKFYLGFFILLPVFFVIFALGPSLIILAKIHFAMKHQAANRDALLLIYDFTFKWTIILSATALVAGLAVAYSFIRPVRKLLREGAEDLDEFGSLGKEFTEMALSFRNYLSILENISGGIITIDKKGIIKMANRQAHTILECDQKELIETALTEKIGDIRGLLKRVFSGNTESGEIAYKKMKIIGYTLTPVRGITGIDGAVFSFKDITGIRQIHERIKQTERLASIGTLAREIAHEVRNPLAAIKGITQMLGEDINEQDPKKRYIEAVMKEIDRLSRVVDNLLEKGDREIVSIKEMLHRAVLLCSQNEKLKHVRVIEEYDETIAVNNIDERLSQAFYNVILNAFEAVDEHGEVIVRAKNHNHRTVIEIISSSVISRDMAQKIFEEGFTTKAGGHGMGLKIAMDAVKSSGGDIFAETTKEGTKFSIILPGGE